MYILWSVIGLAKTKKKNGDRENRKKKAKTIYNCLSAKC